MKIRTSKAKLIKLTEKEIKEWQRFLSNLLKEKEL